VRRMSWFGDVRKQLRFGRKQRAAARRPLVAETPYFVCNIELTNNCPMKCVMCPRTKHMSRDIGYMDLDVFCKIIDEMVVDNPQHLAGKLVALHHFGESLMHREVDQFIAYAESQGVSTVLSVNPITFTDRVIDQLLDSAPSQLFISLDGHDDKSFFAIRGVEDAWERSREKLFKYLERKRERGVKTRIVVNMIDFKLNRNSIDQLKDYWEKVPGVDEFCAKSFGTWIGDAQEINEFKDGQLNVLKQQDARKSYVSCNRPWETLTVTWDGDVVPCCYDYDKKEPLGNVRDQTLKAIWNGDPMRRLREQFVTGRIETALCRDCEELRTIL
jgi:radical SAM protein with 4Fe4S-binding SPASM domain